MGLFDLFGSREERDQAAVRKLSQKLTQKWGPQENRQKAADQLEAMATHAAWKALCLRFTMRSEVGIQDDEEKEHVRATLVRAGGAALPAVKEFLSEQESGVAWGLRVLAELAPGEVAGTALALLHRLSREYTRDPEKKLVLLAWLREHPALLEGPTAGGPGLADAVIPLLEDFVDEVRIAAARTLAAAPPDGDAARDALIALLLRDRDNARVRGEVLQALLDLGADVKGHRGDVEGVLVEPFFLDREGRVKKRGA